MTRCAGRPWGSKDWVMKLSRPLDELVRCRAFWVQGPMHMTSPPGSPTEVFMRRVSFSELASSSFRMSRPPTRQRHRSERRRGVHLIASRKVLCPLVLEMVTSEAFRGLGASPFLQMPLPCQTIVSSAQGLREKRKTGAWNWSCCGFSQATSQSTTAKLACPSC